MRILILEDSNERIEQFKDKLPTHSLTICQTVDSCIKTLIDEPRFDYIFLDHDLSVAFSQPGKGTGYEVACWIVDNPSKTPRRILIHSLNNIGAAAMMRVLGDANIRATYIPFLWQKLQLETV